MRPTLRHHTHRPKRRATSAGWRTSHPRHHDSATERELRPGLLACLLLVSDYGRGLRLVAGGLLISLGAAAGGGPLTTALAAIGLTAMLAALFDLCLVAPLLGCPADGSAIRKAAARNAHAG